MHPKRLEVTQGGGRSANFSWLLRSGLDLLLQANNLQRQYAQWEQLPVGSSETAQLAKELLSGFESVEWQVRVVCLS